MPGMGETDLIDKGESCGDIPQSTIFDTAGSAAAGGRDGAGGFALMTAGGEQRMLFKNEGAVAE